MGLEPDHQRFAQQGVQNRGVGNKDTVAGVLWAKADPVHDDEDHGAGTGLNSEERSERLDGHAAFLCCRMMKTIWLRWTASFHQRCSAKHKFRCELIV
jgi:hypothetical protein